MLLSRTFLTRPLADRVSRGLRARRRNSARQSQGDKAGIDSFRPRNGRCTTSTSTSMIASLCATHPSPWREERRGISRRMEVVVISFGLWPMFDVTCRPRAVPTRHGMFGSRTRQRGPPPSIFRRFPLHALWCALLRARANETDTKRSLLMLQKVIQDF